MNQNSISPDDPRLTAYALNEMAPAERTEFDQALAQDAAARQAVAEIRTTAATLTTALADEPLPVPAEHDFAPAAILPGSDPRKLDGGPGLARGWLTKPIKFPQFYYMVSGLAAACFALFFVYWQRNQPVPEQKKYIELSLAKAATTDGAMKTEPSIAVNLPVASPSAPASLREQSEMAGAVHPLDEADKPVQLDAFVVSAPVDQGYGASANIAGSRIRTQLGNLSGLSSGAGKSWSFAMKNGSARSELERNTEAYGYRRDNEYLRVADQPLSTFSADVDTASYANVRRFLSQGQRPPADAVRIEELVNYFPYAYAGPEVDEGRVPAPGNDHNLRGGGTLPTNRENPPFAASLEVAGAPWAPEHRLVRIGLKGREVSEAARPAANLVFLLDVSGSMNEPNKLPLVKQSLRMLVEKLRPDDQVAIAIYAGASGLALPSTKAAHKAEILDAIDRLAAGGSTNGAMGIQLAYDLAKANFITGGVNRVILATDGDFNVGVTSEGELVRLVEEKAKSGVYLTVLGFGMGNLKDSTLEQLADKGNGNYAYIDSLAEAKKTLVEQAGGTLVTIAQDVKLQVEFNPAVVQAYRLIGYENRLLAKEDFKNDKVDAGEVGAGHTVTALYEVVPVGVMLPEIAPGVDALKYQAVSVQPSAISNGRTESRQLKAQSSLEMLTVKIRYKEPAGRLGINPAAQRLTPTESNTDPVAAVSRQLEFPLRDTGASFAGASPDFKFAAAVAAFGMVLRDSPHKGTVTLADVLAWSRAGLGSDAGGYRNEFIGLVERARQILQ